MHFIPLHSIDSQPSPNMYSVLGITQIMNHTPDLEHTRNRPEASPDEDAEYVELCRVSCRF
jgi:hypothetical protein